LNSDNLKEKPIIQIEKLVLKADFDQEILKMIYNLSTRTVN